MSGTLVALAAAAAVAIAALAAVVLVRAQRRARRQIAELLARLERLEQRHGDLAAAGREDRSPGAQAKLSSPAAEDVAGQETPPSGDVLAGLTSHVRRLVHAPGEVVSLADQAIVCIHRHLEENVQPAQIAEELLVSLRTLERGLAMDMDCTPRQLIVAMKMREARRLLLDGRHRVADVAERLGFADPFHFSRRFKSFYGVSPSEVRPEAGSRRDTVGGLQA